jgi:hypothetical protein
MNWGCSLNNSNKPSVATVNWHRLSKKLLKQIRGMIPASKVRRLKTLQKKRHEQGLSALEQAEILRISDFIELKSAERVALLSQLATLRQITVRELVKQLDLKTFYG